MNLKRLLVVNCVAVALLAALPAEAASGRSACTLHAANTEGVAQSPAANALSLDAAHPAGLVNWDVRWWQRHRLWITLEADNRGDAVAHVLPQMTIDTRADGGAALVVSGPELAIAPHARATQRLSVYVPEDAKTLGVLALVAPPFQAVDATFALDCSEARFDSAQVAPTVAPLLQEALRTWFDNYVDPLDDPATALQTAGRLASGAQDGGDVVWSLRALMQSLRDDHGFALASGESAPAPGARNARAPQFDWQEGLAIVRLHPMGPASEAAASAWAATVHDGIEALAARHPRAWIVDLRDFDADSPWPAFAGLSTLLGGPAVGAFVIRQGTQPWIVDRGAARIAGSPAIVDLQSPPEAAFRGPVAVLIGADTRDAGEDVAVAFQGRAHTRFFGAATAGFPTQGVRPHRLSDGSVLGVLETRAQDRTGVVYRQALQPDVLLTGQRGAEPTPARALDWVLQESAGDR